MACILLGFFIIFGSIVNGMHLVDLGVVLCSTLYIHIYIYIYADNSHAHHISTCLPARKPGICLFT